MWCCQGQHPTEVKRKLEMKRKIILSVLVSSVLFADTLTQDLMGFDDTNVKIVEQKDDAKTSTDEVMDGFDDESSSEVVEEKTPFITGLTGKLTEQVAYSYNGNAPHDKFTSLKTSLLLDYEHKFENGWRVKTNAKAYYDAVYDLRDEDYSSDELKEQRAEVELFDAYVEGSITESFDLKVGRQVLVWGRSDTIRITDVLNPLDNRRPGMVDIEDLRLPVGLVKADYFVGDWRITPIAIVEQRFSKNPAFGSAFNPMQNPYILESDTDDVTYALSVGGEFSGWDVNFYAAHMYDDEGYIKFGATPTQEHEKVNMFGTALNVLSGAWLFKTELAYFEGLKYTATQEKEFSRCYDPYKANHKALLLAGHFFLILRYWFC